MHLQLLDLAGAVDVVGYGVAPGVRMCSDEVPPETAHIWAGNWSEHHTMRALLQTRARAQLKCNGVAYCSPMMGDTSMSKLREHKSNMWRKADTGGHTRNQ